MRTHKVRDYDGSGLHEIWTMECGEVNYGGQSKDRHSKRWKDVNCEGCIEQAAAYVAAVASKSVRKRIDTLATTLGTDRKSIIAAALEHVLGRKNAERRMRKAMARRGDTPGK